MVKRLIWPSSIFPKLRSGTVQRFSRAGGKYSSKNLSRRIGALWQKQCRQIGSSAHISRALPERFPKSGFGACGIARKT
jgi:hypothetical protein